MGLLNAGVVNPLLEREGELAALEAVVAAARVGAGRVVAVEGPAGIGKTRLLAEARRLATAAGVEAVTARGSELEEEFAYGVVRQLFEPLLAAASDGVRAELLAGAAGLAAPLFDERRLAAALTAAGDVGFATLHGLYWLAANLTARRPVLLVVDDLQWADAPSLRWLLYLAHRLEAMPLVLLAALRPLAQSRSGALLGELVSDPGVVLLRPGPLTSKSVAALVGEAFAAEPEDAFCDACRRATGGNPLLLRALVGTLLSEGVAPTADAAEQVAQSGPEPVARAVAVRLSRLPGEVTDLARAIAILGDGAQLGTAAALARLDQAAAGSGARELHRAGLIDLEPRLAFSHAIVRAAAYGGIDAVERDAAHRRAASLLAAAGVEPEQPAAHLLRLGPGGEAFAVGLLRQAAGRALGRGAPDAASPTSHARSRSRPTPRVAPRCCASSGSPSSAPIRCGRSSICGPRWTASPIQWPPRRSRCA